MLDLLLQYLIGPLVGGLAVRYLGAQRWAKVKKTAKAVLADDQNPITSPRDAIERAIIAEHYREIEKSVEALKAQQARGELEIRTSVESARATFDGAERNILQPDGSEKVGPGWPLK